MSIFKYCGLVKTLGFKHFVWKAWSIFKKKIAVEKLLLKRYGYNNEQIQNIDYYQLFQATDNCSSIFSSIRRQDLEAKVRNLPKKDKAILLKNALEIVEQHKISFFSKETIVIKKIDFNYDYFENIKWETGKHSSMYFQFDWSLGDIKKVWELNRLQFLNPLVLGYLSTCDRTLINKIRGYLIEVLNEWFDQNPYAQSVAWACSQETSIRNFNLLFYNWIFDLKTEKDLGRKIANELFLAAEKVYKEINFARAQRNNHAITESMFLLLIAHAFPNLPNKEKYIKKGSLVLKESIKDQFFEDGTYIQNSHTYHRFALQSLLITLLVVNDDDLEQLILSTISRSYVFFKQMISNDRGEFPNYGPNDGALLFNWASNDYRNAFPLLNLMSIVLGADEKFGDDFADLDQLILNLASKSESMSVKIENRTDFEESGYYVLEKGKLKVHFRCGSYLRRYPSQCDMLHLDIWYNGKNIFTDRGTFEYYSHENPEIFYEYLSTASHNTIKIGGKEQMEKGPRFTWLSSIESELLQRKPYHVIGQHRGYRNRIFERTLHRRSVKLHTGIIIQDFVEDVQGHEIKLFWHLGKCQIIDKGNGTLLIQKEKLVVKFKSAENLKIEIKETPKSYYYAHAETTPSLEITCKTSDKDLLIQTEIIPINDI